MLAAAVQLPAPTGRRLGLGFRRRPRLVRLRGGLRSQLRLVLGPLPMHPTRRTRCRRTRWPWRCGTTRRTSWWCPRRGAGRHCCSSCRCWSSSRPAAAGGMAEGWRGAGGAGGGADGRAGAAGGGRRFTARRRPALRPVRPAGQHGGGAGGGTGVGAAVRARAGSRSWRSTRSTAVCCAPHPATPEAEAAAATRATRLLAQLRPSGSAPPRFLLSTAHLSEPHELALARHAARCGRGGGGARGRRR